MSSRRALLDDLVVERFAPVAPRTPTPAQSGGEDTPAAIAERQRRLVAALDGDHLVSVDSSTERAA